MWDDRFLFVLATLASITACIFLRQDRGDIQTSRVSNVVARWIIFSLIMTLIVAIICARVWTYRNDLTVPNLGSAIAVLIGVVFGSFTAKFVASLFGSQFGRRDPIIGAAVLVLVSVAYSLPLYSNAISSLLSGIGVSTVKTPFLELTVRERGNKSSANVSSGQMINPGAIRRESDPSPGLNWLRLDTGESPTDTLPADLSYIEFLEESLTTSDEYKALIQNTKDFLEPVRVLSECLSEYVNVFSDSQLLLLDIKPVLESLFMLHARARQDAAKQQAPELGYPAGEIIHLGDKVIRVLQGVNAKFSEGGDTPLTPFVWDAKGKQCNESRIKDKMDRAITVSYLQPYTTLILADLLVAHGAGDEAINVLAEWLDFQAAYRKKDATVSKKTPAWFTFRIQSRITLFLADVAGQNNVSYRDFLKDYKTKLEDYVKASPHHLDLDQIVAKCKSWLDSAKGNVDKQPTTGQLGKQPTTEQAGKQPATEQAGKQPTTEQAGKQPTTEQAGKQPTTEQAGKQPTTEQAGKQPTTEQKVFYLLLANEDEALRTEINFIADASNFEGLDHLHRRASFLANIGKECLPSNLEDPAGTISDHQVTAGLVGLTVADRMSTIARSRGDRDRATEIARDAEKVLRTGYVNLNSSVDRYTAALRQPDVPWSRRVFAQSPWEKSTSLAARAFIQLRNRDN
jgi:hypothetical protein